jgi:hypothetical protein
MQEEDKPLLHIKIVPLSIQQAPQWSQLPRHQQQQGLQSFPQSKPEALVRESTA